MTNNPVSQFEEALRRATRRKGSDDQIKEVASHYDDLYNEALNKGATVEEARKHADEHIGEVAEIAKEIRSGNGKSNGIKLQWIAMALFVLGALLPQIAGMNGYEIGSLRGRIIESASPFGLVTVCVAGFLTVLGLLRAKRVATLAFCLAIILIPAGHTALLLRFTRSFSSFDAGMKRHDAHWHQYAVKYRPIMSERYDLYVTSISGSQEASDQAIRKLSATIKRPQDRGVVFFRDSKGKWIYPVNDQKARARNIKVFPLTKENLNWITFDATDSFALAQKEWRSSNDLLKSIPILRKGSEAEFARTSEMHSASALAIVRGFSLASMIPFLYSFVFSFLLLGIATKMDQIKRRRRAQ